MPFSRQSSRSRRAPVAGLVACLALSAICLPALAGPKSEQAKQHYQYASLLLNDLRSVPKLELGKEQYLLVAKAFRKVYLTSPASGYSDDSLLAEARLYREAAERFGRKVYLSKALETYRFLIREYPRSKLKQQAGRALAELGVPSRPESALAKLPNHPAPEKPLKPQARKQEASAPNRAASPAQHPPSARATPARYRPATLKRRTGPATVRDLRFWSQGEYTRVVLEVDAEVPYVFERLSHPERLFVDLKGARLGKKLRRVKNYTLAVNDSLIKRIRVGQNRRWVTRVVFDLEQPTRHSVHWLSNPGRLVVELRAAAEPVSVATDSKGGSKTGSRGAGKPTQKPNDAALVARADRLPSAKQAQHPAAVKLGPAPGAPSAVTSNGTAAKKPDLNPDAATVGRSSSPGVAGNPPAVVPGTRPPSATSGTPAAKSEPASTRLSAKAGRAASKSEAPEQVAPAAGMAGKAVTEPVSLGEIPLQAKAEMPDPVQAASARRAFESGTAASVPAATEARVESKQATPSTAAATLPPNKQPGPASEPKGLSKGPSPAPAGTVAESPPKLRAKYTPPELPTLELAEAPKPAAATSRGKRNLIRALGLKVGRVVIDAGHGGHDTGTIGPGGLREKDLVLDIASRLGELIESRLGAEVVYTRTVDRFVPLKARTKLANDSEADLFISVHANSSRLKNIRGVETYYLSFTTNSRALAVASRENAAAQRSIHELQDLLSKIALTEKVEESREFAGRVQKALYTGLSGETKGLRNRGVRKAPFLVLVGAKMPAVLAEVGFLSNAHDEKLLQATAYRRKVAEHIYKGVEQYANSLSKLALARKQSPSSADGLE